MAIATFKVSTSGLALASPGAVAKYCLCREGCTGRNSSTLPKRNLRSVKVGRCKQVADFAASPAGSDGWNSANCLVNSRSEGCSVSTSSNSKRRRGSLSVPIRAAADASDIATATTTGDSLEDLRCKSESFFLTDPRPVVLFDGICNFCNTGVNFLLDNDLEGKFRFASLQSDAGRALLAKSGRSPDDLSSIVLVYKDRSYTKSEAVLRMSRELRFPFTSAGLIGLLFPLFVRDAVYDQVANNRYNIYGRTNMCRLSDPRFPERAVRRFWNCNSSVQMAGLHITNILSGDSLYAMCHDGSIFVSATFHQRNGPPPGIRY